jgi:hypothetical protein
MSLTRSVIVGGLAAGGLVLALANPASAHGVCGGHDYDDDDHEYQHNWNYDEWEANHVGSVHVDEDSYSSRWQGVIINAFD